MIVGGGYTGLWTALALAERAPDLRIVLLEAGLRRARAGGTAGSSTGTGRASRCSGSGSETRRRSGWPAPPRLVAAVRALGEDVGLVEGGFLKVSAAPAQDASVDAVVAAAQALGVPEEAVPLSEDDVQASCESPVFRRGVFVRRGATVQPALLARTLRRRAEVAGITIHEHSPVRRVRSGEVETADGRVRARDVIVAVNAGPPPGRCSPAG